MTSLPSEPASRLRRDAKPWWTLRRLVVIGLGWSLLLAAAAVAIIRHDLAAQRSTLHHSAQQRMQGVRAALKLTLEQTMALTIAQAHLDETSDFLAHMARVDGPIKQDALLQDERVVQISIRLRNFAREAKLDGLWLVNTRAQVVADSSVGNTRVALGQSALDSRFFNEAASTGRSQRIDDLGAESIPMLVSSAQVPGEDSWRGQVVALLAPGIFHHLLDDPNRRLLLTDSRGRVIALGGGVQTEGPAATALNWRGRVPMQAGLVSGLDDERGGRMLPWEAHPTTVEAQTAWEVTIDGIDYLAESLSLEGSDLNVWCLTPLRAERTLVHTRLAEMGLFWALGLGLIVILWQRSLRLHNLRRSRQDLSDMADALPLVLFRHEQRPGQPGRFTFLSQGADALLGLAEGQLMASPELAWQLVAGAHSDDAPAATGPLLPPTQAAEFPVQRQGGTAHWVACDSHAHRLPDGTTVHNGFWMDITARKEVEARTQAVFRHAPLALVFYRPDAGILRCNPSAIRLFGAQQEADLLGRQPWTDLSVGEQDSAARQAIADTHQQRQTRSLDWRFQPMHGDPFDAEVVLIAFHHNGQPQYCAIIQNITARKQADVALRQAQAASEAATEAKTRFLANMSHEIRTPMNAIMGMTHLALLEALPTKARNYVDKAHRAANNLLQIINDVLDVSRVESGKLELEAVPFPLEQVVGHMADVLGLRAEDKGLELLFTAPPDLPPVLVGDPTRLGQILINLGTNAIKFTEQGEVTIGCDIAAQSDSAIELHFWVRDTGIGMTAEQLDKIFQPFVQADTSTTRRYGGTGLGLTISQELVQLMGGRIWAESQPDQGSTFHFTVKLGVRNGVMGSRALMASELRGKRVLLVDDNPTAREVLSDMATRMGLEVDTCSSGLQALQHMQAAAAEGHPHHVLLTDWKMPGMDGISFAKAALALPPEQRPCVLLVTAFSRDEALRAADGIGLAGVINKPVTPSMLHDSLARALGRDVPAPAANSQTDLVLQNARRQLGGAYLLLVEDQPMNQELARDLLERAGIRIVTANHGAEALQALEELGPFDGILMDCQMPVMDGYTATERIRAQARWQHLPIIAMTAGAMASDRERVLACGMNDHITKPLDLGQMFAIMAKWIVPRVAQAVAPVPAPAPATPATPDAMTTPIPTTPEALLGSLSSLDTVDGLSRCMGNMNLYQRLLKGFARTQSDFATQFQDAPDRESVIRVAHTLKGLAGNVGATRLLHAVTELETLMHEATADDPHELRRQVQGPLAITLDALKAVLDDIQRLNQPAPSAQPAAPALLQNPALQSDFSGLLSLIHDHDAMARDRLSEIRDAHPGLQGHPLVQQLQRALDRYDFDAAAQALEGLRQPLG